MRPVLQHCMHFFFSFHVRHWSWCFRRSHCCYTYTVAIQVQVLLVASARVHRYECTDECSRANSIHRMQRQRKKQQLTSSTKEVIHMVVKTLPLRRPMHPHPKGTIQDIHACVPGAAMSTANRAQPTVGRIVFGSGDQKLRACVSVHFHSLQRWLPRFCVEVTVARSVGEWGAKWC